MQHNDQQLAIAEIKLINRVLAAHGVRAGIPESGARSLITPGVHVHGILKADGVAIDAILRRQPEIAESLSEHRRVEHLPVRMDASPLVVEIPAPAPRPVMHGRAELGNPPMHLVAGRTYSIYHGAGQLTLTLNRHHHILIAGQTGAGKSVLMQMMLLSLCARTSPADLEIWLIDLKRDDLFALRRLPHVAAIADDIPTAARLIERLGEEKAQRIAADDTPQRRILLVVDEQAELSGERTAIAEQNSLLSLGRSLHINQMLATQRPTKDNLGGLNLDNITVRCVGNVVDAKIAAFITGRSNTGAEFLARPGGFLAIDGPTTTRFQSYHIPDADVPAIVEAVHKIWRNADRPPRITVSPAPATEQPAISQDLIPQLAEQARPAFAEHFDQATQQLKFGGLAAIITAIYGSGANTGGSNRRTALQVVEHLKNTTTTTQSARILTLPRRSAAGD